MSFMLINLAVYPLATKNSSEFFELQIFDRSGLCETLSVCTYTWSLKKGLLLFLKHFL